jgi:hypothetical protein
MALHRQQGRAVRHPPQPHLPRRRPRCQQRPIRTQRDRSGEIEPVSQHALGEMAINETSILRLYLRQVGLPNRQAREVQSAQVAPQQSQKVDHVARNRALLLRRPPTPALQQKEQQLLSATLVVVRLQPLQHRRPDQPLLRLAHVLLSLRLDKRLSDQHERATTFDLLGSGLDHSIGHVLEHHRLQRNRRSVVASLHQ